jgi:hypothetical protein
MSEHVCKIAKKTESEDREYQIKAEVVRAMRNDWQDADKGAGWKWIVHMDGWRECR